MRPRLIRTFGALCIGVAVLCSSACGAGSDGASVAATWFAQEGDEVQGIVVMTAGPDDAGRLIRTHVTYRDQNGETIATAEWLGSVSWADQQLAVPVHAPVDGTPGGQVASMSADVEVSDEQYDTPLPRIAPATAHSITPDRGTAASGSPAPEPGPDGVQHFTASFLLHRLPDETQTGVPRLDLGIACYDASGNLIGGTTVQRTMPPDGGLLAVDAAVPAHGAPDSCRAFPSAR